MILAPKWIVEGLKKGACKMMSPSNISWDNTQKHESDN